MQSDLGLIVVVPESDFDYHCKMCRHSFILSGLQSSTDVCAVYSRAELDEAMNKYARPVLILFTHGCLADDTVPRCQFSCKADGRRFCAHTNQFLFSELEFRNRKIEGIYGVTVCHLTHQKIVETANEAGIRLLGYRSDFRHPIVEDDSDNPIFEILRSPFQSDAIDFDDWYRILVDKYKEIQQKEPEKTDWNLENWWLVVSAINHNLNNLVLS